MKAIIVDDEISAIESLQWELGNFCADVDVVDSFTNPKEAISAINYLKPDIVFLDIEMPGIDGFQLLNNLHYKSFDLIITTAYNQYAIQAFKSNAVDYLLKPIDPDDLIKSIEKVKNRAEIGQLETNIEKIIEKFINTSSTPALQRIPLALQDRILMVNTDDIMYCKSDGNYTHVHLSDGNSYMISKTMKVFLSSIPDNFLVKVHKSYVVNIKYVKEYIRGDGGELILSNKKNIPVSRAHKNELLQLLRI